MATVPIFVLGRNVGSGVLTAQTQNATTGVLTAVTGTTASFTGMWKSINLTFSKKTDEISASDVIQENEIPLSRGTNLACEFLMDNVTNNTRDWANLAFGTYDYFSYVVKVGDGGHTYTGYGLLSDYSFKTNDKSAVMALLDFKPCGIDTALS